ncbi:MAG: prepilin peptidase [Legionellaceae bacterium]|nr:prepilin peptidase [Legionellaceae bacterium]
MYKKDKTVELTHPAWAWALLLILAACIGSFLNVVIYRVPQMLKREWERECRCLLGIEPVPDSRAFNLIGPRSHCPHCDIPLRFRDNVPLFSYLFLKGRCHHCQHPISLRYPAVELLSVLLSALAIWHFSFRVELIFALIFIWVTLPIIMIDLAEQIIPDSLSYSLLWSGLVASSFHLFVNLETAVYSAMGAWFSLWLFIRIFYWLTGKIGMGNGDFKLFAALGAWFGWTMLPLILLLSSFVGAVSGMIYLRTTAQSHQTPIPFGPFLCFSGLVTLFWGQDMLNAYWAFYP